MGSDELVARLQKEAAMLREIAKSQARGVDWQANLTASAEWFDRASAQLAEARESERAAVWVHPKSIADMPSKPGKETYEYVPCLIVRKGEVLSRPWNCEHQVFDDEDQDDFYCEWDAITAYMDLSGLIKAYAPPVTGEPA